MLPNIRQILLFSATFPDEVMNYARSYCPAANEIKLKRDELTVGGIKQMFIDCPSDEGKYEILAGLYGMLTIGSSIIFVKVSTLSIPDFALIIYYSGKTLPIKSPSVFGRMATALLQCIRHLTEQSEIVLLISSGRGMPKFLLLQTF